MTTNFKSTTAARTTITRDIDDMVRGTENIYESISIMAKRANQIGQELKEELNTKLEEFATSQDNLEEIFENREQIEISKFYEKLPKPHSMALQEFIEDRVYWRRPDAEQADAAAAPAAE
jgi:DNA-directed RNA polymerase subunit K/omega